MLETTGNISSFRGSPNSAADCLLTWLDQLPQAVIPSALHDEALDAVQAGGLTGALSIVKQLASEQKAAVYQVHNCWEKTFHMNISEVLIFVTAA